MIQINYRDPRPIYEQVKDGFRKLIVQKMLLADERLPSVREIAGSLAINPNTIQRAYRELEQEGYVYTIAGKGSFVSGYPVAQPKKKQELLEKLDDIVDELAYYDMTPEALAAHILSKGTKSGAASDGDALTGTASTKDDTISGNSEVALLENAVMNTAKGFTADASSWEGGGGNDSGQGRFKKT